MKKVFVLMAFAALALIACKPTNTDDPNNPGGDDPKVEEYVQPITCDGKFDDWAKLDASKVYTAKNVEGSKHDALKLVKVYADKAFIFVYFEWDTEQIEWELDVEHVPFHIYLNADGKADTGGFGDQWSDACTEACFEGFLTNGTDIDSYDPGVYQWVGEANGSGWEWSDPAVLDAGSGICSGAGVNGKYELQIVRELYPLGTIADEFSIGFDIQQSWDTVGYLPNGEVTDDNPSGNVPSLKVVTVK
ncbi:MAG: hypothetical protein J5695_00340 [Bacteroidales bacterium]|nr:hypothetical protein [Bacteroidales bacterium]